MDPAKTSQDDPPPPRFIDSQRANNQSAMNQSHCDLSDSLNRLSLANAAATPLPASPSLLSPQDANTPRPSVANTPVPKRSPSTSSLRDERRKSLPPLQKRQSVASLRSVSLNTGPASPLPDSRRSSANFAGSPVTATASPAMLPQRLALSPQEAQGPTAASIAAEHFQKEVDLHQAVDLHSKTLVIVHDACYGHRFSRPRASKGLLASIVERPERIRACVLGIAAAYVRLGRRHAGERFAPHPDLDLHMLPPPFQIRKTARSLALSDIAVTNVHGTQWMSDLKSMCDAAESRLALTGKELVRPRAEGNDGLAFSGPPLHSGDLYLCSESLNAFEGALGGVCEGIDAVLGPGPTSRTFVCIRPPGHHCSSDFPSGFCWINNVHVGISYAAMEHGLTHAAIFDFDLHHGDGSQEITWAHNSKATTAPKNAAPYKKAPIGYYSLHDINSYPCEGGEPDKVRNASVCIDGAHGQSIWNVHLDTWETEAEFWKLYRTKYIALLNKARKFLRTQAQKLAATPNGPPPKAAIFISAGFDASEWESPGMQRHKVNVPTEFYAKFTADVVRLSQEEGLGVDGRVISVLEGGYSDRALTSGVLSHLAGLGSAVPESNESVDSRLASEMNSRMGISTSPKDTTLQHTTGYDPEWWSPTLLTELDTVVAPPKARDGSGSTLFKETDSFRAKKVTLPHDRKSFGSHSASRPHLVPLPEVGWATATHELSKILIPDRQTLSCRPEDLNAEASRQRRERQMALDGVQIPTARPPVPEEKRQLRVRKAKSPTPYSPRPATPRQQAIRKNRRQTIDANELADASQEASPTLDASRRRSANATAPVAMADLSGPEEKLAAASAKSTQRKTSGSRPGTPRRSASPRKAPPVPKVPHAFLPSKLGDEVTLPTEPNNGDDDKMEQISSGLRRIKLVMPKTYQDSEPSQQPQPQTNNSSLSTPAPPAIKHELPVFTPNTPIPFATPPQERQGQNPPEDQPENRPPPSTQESQNPGSQDIRPHYPL